MRTEQAHPSILKHQDWVKANNLYMHCLVSIVRATCAFNASQGGDYCMQAPVTVTEKSECLDEVAWRPHQKWGKAEQLQSLLFHTIH